MKSTLHICNKQKHYFSADEYLIYTMPSIKFTSPSGKDIQHIPPSDTSSVSFVEPDQYKFHTSTK